MLRRVAGRDLPDGGGAYVLVLARRKARRRVRVGALGLMEFPPGFYCYVGSAAAGLRGRIERHLRVRGKAARWHVDYLRRRSVPAGILVWPGPDAQECALSSRVAALAERSVPGFGCSDCGCESHLHYFRRDPVSRLDRLRLPRDEKG